jgi:Protein of unknown function (DUF2950)
MPSRTQYKLPHTSERSLRVGMISFICVSSTALSLLGGCTSTQGAKYASMQDAGNAFISAIDPQIDSEALEVVFGENIDDIISSGDDVNDQEIATKLAEAYKEQHGYDVSDDGITYLVIGEDNWPFAIPLTEHNGSWSFDTDEGRAEILHRRVGRNELDTIQACMAFVDAQLEYARMDPDNDGVREYAKKFRSSVGMKDGLYWATDENEPMSPLGELAAQAAADGYSVDDQPKPEGEGVYHGYRFKMLTSQGPNAEDGSLEYVFNDKMIGGFALVAWPATYGNSGIMTFIVNQDGVIYQKDLGKRTDSKIESMDIFDPDLSWDQVNDEPFENLNLEE